MASSSTSNNDLTNIGIYFDEIDKICILEPDAARQTNDLKDECQIYGEKIDEFQKIAGQFVEMQQQLGDAVERQKIKAIGARNLLQSMEKQKETGQRQLRALIGERQMELERLKVQLNSLQRTEMEQHEVIGQLTHY